MGAHIKQWLRPVRDALAETLRRLPVSSEVMGPPKDEDHSFEDFVARGSRFARRSRERRVFPSVLTTLPAARVFGDAKGLVLGAETYASAPVSVFTCPNARVFTQPPAIIGPDDRLFAFASNWHSADVRSHFAFHQLRLGRLRRLVGRTLYLGGNSNLWHFYGDTLRQVAVLQATGQTLADFDHVIVKRPTASVERYFYPLLGLQDDRLVDGEAFRHIHCEQLTFLPSGSNRRGREEVRALRAFLFATIGLAEKEKTRRVYISRAAAGFRRVMNEPEIVARLQRRGFECLRLEDMTIDDQVRAFCEAKIVVGPHGAGLANILFCAPGTQIVELRNPTFQPSNGASEIYRTIGGLLDLTYLAVFAAAAGSVDSHRADLTFAPEEIDAAVDAAEIVA